MLIFCTLTTAPCKRLPHSKPDIQEREIKSIRFRGCNERKKAQPELVWSWTPSTGISVVNKINMLRKSLLKYQYLNNVIKSKKTAFYDLDITICNTTIKMEKRVILPHQFRLTLFFYQVWWTTVKFLDYGIFPDFFVNR